MRFVRARNGNLDECCAMFAKYVKTREAHPYCYKTLDISEPSLSDLMQRGYMFPLLERDPKGTSYRMLLSPCLSNAEQSSVRSFRL